MGKLGGPLACAPEVRNYALFYEASASPAWEVLAEDFGHADMEDLNSLEPLACISNPIRADMITFTAGQLVSFFAHALQGASTESYLQSFDTAPIAASGRFK